MKFVLQLELTVEEAAALEAALDPFITELEKMPKTKEVKAHLERVFLKLKELRGK